MSCDFGMWVFRRFSILLHAQYSAGVAVECNTATPKRDNACEKFHSLFTLNESLADRVSCGGCYTTSCMEWRQYLNKIRAGVSWYTSRIYEHCSRWFELWTLIFHMLKLSCASSNRSIGFPCRIALSTSRRISTLYTIYVYAWMHAGWITSHLRGDITKTRQMEVVDILRQVFYLVTQRLQKSEERAFRAHIYFL